MKTSRVCIVVWVATVAAALNTPSSAPFWIRITIAAIVAAPVVAALLVWPVLIVRGLPEVTADQKTPETRIKALPAPSSGQDGRTAIQILEDEYGIVGRPYEGGDR